MREELDSALCEKYPLIFKNRYGDMRETCMCWGFSCGDGWYTIIDKLCEELYHKYTQACWNYERARSIEGSYVKNWNKEKQEMESVLVDSIYVERRRLEMAQAASEVPVASQVKEKFGTLRFYVEKATPEQYDIISFVESLSSRVCEECGDTATAKTRSGGWIRTLCDSCEDEHQKNRAQAN